MAILNARGRVKRWSDGTVKRWNDGMMERWNDGAMERWSGRTMKREQPCWREDRPAAGTETDGDRWIRGRAPPRLSVGHRHDNHDHANINDRPVFTSSTSHPPEIYHRRKRSVSSISAIRETTYHRDVEICLNLPAILLYAFVPRSLPLLRKS